MGNLALPFSLSDILERVIPGSLLLAAWFFALDLTVDLPAVFENAALASAVFLATSYAVGVALNALPEFFEIQGYRQYWTADPDEHQQAIQAAIEAHFGVKADTDTWKLCYGTCTKNGYGANTQLFLGLDVFCRTMAVTSILSGLALVVASIREMDGIVPSLSEAILLGTVLAFAGVFRRGARIYSQAFVSSIYEGFFNWYCDQRSESTHGRTHGA